MFRHVNLEIRLTYHTYITIGITLSKKRVVNSWCDIQSTGKIDVIITTYIEATEIVCCCVP